MSSIVDPPPDGKTQPDGVREISPDAALWLVRRSLILDYLNEQQPVDQRHNKRMAADLIRWVQEWCYADGQRATEHAALVVEARRPHIPPSADPGRRTAVIVRSTLNRAARAIRGDD